MTVQVAFEIRIGPTRAPAVALFLPIRDVWRLFAICSELGLDPNGRVYDLAGGFLLKLDRPRTEVVAGAIRLRALWPDFYLPVDALLVPGLLEDEAAGLVRDGGLVLLPGDRILRFDHRAAMDLSQLVFAEPRPPRAWTPLPAPRRLAERVVSITWEQPEVPPESLYQDLEQEIRRRGDRRKQGAGADVPTESMEGSGRHGEKESSEKERGGDGQAGKAGGASHRFMPRVEGLAKSFRGMIGQAGAGIASLREKFQWEWVDHSSLVQKLLHEFRVGDSSQALRHALPITPADSRHERVGAGNRLPFSRAIYSLTELLGRVGRGKSVGIWRARSDLMMELVLEYRKAAEEAIRQGDFRRTAYIYGKLLGEDRMAAQVLQRGGLHGDAAILYLKKLNDPGAAAAAFEAAGETDRAVELYRQLGQHTAAGHLLNRIGEEAAAAREYILAAEVAAGSMPPDYHESGRILNGFARRPDLALAHFRKGWEQRPASNAIACAIEIAVIHAERGEIGMIRGLLDEAEVFFRGAGLSGMTATFYQTLVALTRKTRAMAPYAEELRDRALIVLAGILRAEAEAGRAGQKAISTLFGAPSIWPNALIRDAEFAIGSTQKQCGVRERSSSVGYTPSLNLIQFGHGTVTALSQSSTSREVFVGFEDGKVVCLRTGGVDVVPVSKVPGAVSALAVDPEGQAVVTLRQTESSAILSCSLRGPDGVFRSGPETHLSGCLGSWLTPILPWVPEWLVGVGYGRELIVVDAVTWLFRASLSIGPMLGEPSRTALLVPAVPPSGPPDDRFLVLTHDATCWVLLDSGGRELDRYQSAWCPADSPARPLRSAPAIWTSGLPIVDLVGLDKEGVVYLSEFRVMDGRLMVTESHSAHSDQVYLAATRAGSGSNTVVAVSRTRIDWLSLKGNRYQPTRSLPCPGLSPAVGCFSMIAPDEILVVFVDGTAGYLESPRIWSRSSRGT